MKIFVTYGCSHGAEHDFDNFFADKPHSADFLHAHLPQDASQRFLYDAGALSLCPNCQTKATEGETKAAEAETQPAQDETKDQEPPPTGDL